MIVVLGGGPAGLTAARELLRLGRTCIVLEKDSDVGGLSRTLEYKGFLFDVGGHRFFTTSRLVRDIWNDVLGDDFITRPRLSRIFYRGHFFRYPLESMDVLRGLGPWEVLRCVLSYGKAQIMPHLPEEDFATWVKNRFGARLFEMFFRTYTEKVWGMRCEEIGAEWAAQRIRGLDMKSVAMGALRGGRSDVRSLTQTFEYPRRGPGMLWSRMAEELRCGGVDIRTNAAVQSIERSGDRVDAVIVDGERIPATQVISTLALRDLVHLLRPSPDAQLRRAAGLLSYRDFLIVALMVDGRDLFPDNWIYVHEPGVKVGRIQNFNNWSPEMSPDPNITSLGMEYFCSAGDALWETPDAELLQQAGRELRQLGLVGSHRILDGTVLRVPRAYPVYDAGYREAMPVLRDFVTAMSNLHVAGRNGMHRYNNQDHAMLSGILAARNALGANHDVWAVNADGHYLEETSDELERQWTAIAADQPMVPERVVARNEAASD